MTFLARLLVLFSISRIHLRESVDGKQFGLTLLSLVSYTGSEPRDGRMCQAGMQIAVDNVNARSDILQNYKLHVDFQDEGTGGMKTSRQVVEFVRRFSDSLNSTVDGKYQSAIAVGPLLSDGCRRMAQIIHHVDMVAVGTGCFAPSLTANRQYYPNFYRASTTSEMVVFSRLIFIREIGKWKKIALLTHTNNLFDYSLAAMTQKAALDSGLKVIWFDIVPELSIETLRSLKQSDARIIIIDINFVGVIQQFFCEAYNVGITGPRYVFIAQTSAFASPYTSPEIISDRCSRAKLLKQFESTFWIGIVIEPGLNNGPTSSGYDLETFERIFDNYTGIARTPDYSYRHRCHDPMLLAILALDRAEKALNRINMTIRDYRWNPIAVMKAVNESAAMTDYYSLRVGHSKYSGRLEMDDEPQYISQWSPGKGLQITHLVFHAPGAGLENFTFRELIPVNWGTANNELPKDGPLTVLKAVKFPEEAFKFVAILASISICCQLILITRSMLSLFRLPTAACDLPGINIATFSNTCPKVLATIGCVLLNLGSISLACMTYASLGNDYLCQIRIATIVLGFAFLNSFLTSLVIVSENKATNSATRHNYAISVKSPHNVESAGSSLAIHSGIDNREGRRIYAVMLLIATITSVLLCIWLLLYPTNLQLHYGSFSYQESTDTLFQPTVTFCQINYSWMFGLVAVNLAMLVIGLSCAYRRIKESQSAGRTMQEIKSCWMVMANNATIIIATTLIIAAQVDPVAAEVTVAIAVLFISTISSFAIGRDDITCIVLSLMSRRAE